MLKERFKTFINASNHKRPLTLFFSLGATLFSVAVAALSWWILAPQPDRIYSSTGLHQKSSLFALNYPANAKFQKELVELKSSNQLKTLDELEIQKSLLAVAEYLEMPPALIWCLLFQESRLNHLEGIDTEKATLGLGQFSRFSFYEINHQQNNFASDNSNLFFLMFGRDIRPLAAKQRDIVNPSSYFHIPTAVVASSIYLHNRYFHLTKILNQRGIPYSPDILWLFSAMAYNKGTRSVLNLWNSVYNKRGPDHLHQLLNNLPYFKKTTEDSLLLTKTLKKIWPDQKARAYSRELTLHTKNITSCSISPVFQPNRSLMETEP